MATERLAILLETIGVGGVIADFRKVSRSAADIDVGTGKASKGLERLSSMSGVSAQSLQTGIIAAAAIGAAALVKFGQSAVEASSGLNEQMSATGVVFGGAAEAVVAFGERASATMGLSQREALKAANAIGGMFTGLGASQDQAAGASMALVQLAADLASFRDVAGGAPEVLEKLRSGLTGEVEPLRNLGIFLNEATVNAKAAEMGFTAVNGVFTDGAKISARYALIMEQTKDAQGDFARTSESFANQQRTLSAQWEDLIANVGGPIETVTAAVLKGINVQIGGIRRLIGAQNDSAAAEKARALQAIAAEELRIEQIRTMEMEKEAYEELKDSVFGLANAERDLSSASRSLSSAQRDLADKQRTLNELLAQGAVDEKEVARARRDLTNATRDAERANTQLARAQERLGTAQAALNELLSGGGATKEEKVADARDDLTSANLRLRGATQRQEQAQANLTRVQNDATSTTADLAAAQLELDEANFDVEQATKAVTTAQTALNTAEQIGAENSPEVVKARGDVADATDDVATATDNVATATQNVNDAQAALGTALAGDPNYTEAVADARQGVADATQAVADASHNVAQKAYEATQKQNEFNTAMGTGIGKAHDLKRELDALQAAHPELAPLLAPVLSMLSGALVAGINAASASVIAPRGQVRLSGPAVPGLQHGGIIPAGSAPLAQLHGPEAVIPLSRGGAAIGGTVINVTVNAGIAGDADRVGNEIYAVLKRMASRNGGLGLN